MTTEKYHIDNYINTGNKKSFEYLSNKVKRIVKTKIDKFNLDVDTWLFEDLFQECMCHIIEDLSNRKTIKSVAYDYHWNIELMVLSSYLGIGYQMNLNHNTVKKLFNGLVRSKWLTVRDILRITKETAVSASTVLVIHNMLHGDGMCLDADRFEIYESDEDYYDGEEIGTTEHEPYNILCRKDVDRLMDVAVEYFQSKRKGTLDLFTIITGEMSTKEKIQMCGISDTRIRQIIKKEISLFKSEKMIDMLDYSW